jgi:hypothetical protein
MPRYTPVEKTGSMNAPASPTKSQRSPASARLLYDQSEMVRTGSTRRALRSRSARYGAAAMRAVKQASSGFCPLSPFAGPTKPTLVRSPRSGITHHQPSLTSTMLMSPSRSPDARVAPS